MAVDEAEYYTLHQGNGLSGGVREPRSPAKAKPHVSKTQTRPGAKTATGAKSGWTSFVQGITLGTVLLIPVGVWCWVRADELAPPVAESQTAPGKVKAAKAKPVSKRKPVRGNPSPLPRTVVSEPVRVAVPEPPPAVPVPVPAPSALPVAATVPHLDQDLNSATLQKKGFWKTLVSPFRGRSKDTPTRNEAEFRD